LDEREARAVFVRCRSDVRREERLLRLEQPLPRVVAAAASTLS